MNLINNPLAVSLFFEVVLEGQIHLNSTEKTLDEKWSEAIGVLESNPLLHPHKFDRVRLKRIHELYMRMRRNVEKAILNDSADSQSELLLRRIYDEVKADRSSYPNRYKGIKPYTDLPSPSKKARVDVVEVVDDDHILQQTKALLSSYNPELCSTFYGVVDQLLVGGVLDQSLACKAIEMADDPNHLTKMKKLPTTLLSLYIKNTLTHQ